MDVNEVTRYIDELVATVGTTGDDMTFARALCERACAATARGRHQAAVELLVEAFELVQRVLGPDDARLGWLLRYVAEVVERRGQYVRAAALRRRAARLELGKVWS
jgi:hypothetical protein